MKIRKKNIWISVFILLILTPFIMLFVDSKIPHYTKLLSSILGVENIEAEFMDTRSTWMVSYDIYQLSDASVKEFLAKENKELYELEGYKKLNWRKGRMDSLSYLEYKEYINSLCSITLIDSTKTRELYDSLKYITHNNYLRYKGYFSYQTYLDSLRKNNDIDSLEFIEYSNYRDYVSTLSYIEENLSSGFGNNVKVKNHIQTIRKLFYANSYYALHYKSEYMFYLYLLDEKNKLLYITSYWL